jgi:Amt family ammonium transporter
VSATTPFPARREERAYDFRTAERLGALISGRSVDSDDELVQQITRLLRAREHLT